MAVEAAAAAAGVVVKGPQVAEVPVVPWHGAVILLMLYHLA